MGPVPRREEARAVALRERGRPCRVQPVGQGNRRVRRNDDAAGKAAQPDRRQHAVADGHIVTSVPTATAWPATSLPGTKGREGLISVLPGYEETIDEVHASRLDRNGHLAGPGSRIRAFLHPQHGGWSQLVADGGTHGRRR